MPIYEYICEKCGNEFEMLVFKSDEPACPSCGNIKPTKKMSSFGYVEHSRASASLFSSTPQASILICL